MRLVIGSAAKGHTLTCISLSRCNISLPLGDPQLQTIGQGDTFILVTL